MNENETAASRGLRPLDVDDPRGENGQAMVEYMILVVVIVSCLAGFYRTYTQAVRNNFDYLTAVWMLPVP